MSEDKRFPSNAEMIAAALIASFPQYSHPQESTPATRTVTKPKTMPSNCCRERQTNTTSNNPSWGWGWGWGW